MHSADVDSVPDLNIQFYKPPIPTMFPAYAVYTPYGYCALNKYTFSTFTVEISLTYIVYPFYFVIFFFLAPITNIYCPLVIFPENILPNPNGRISP
jgi:hypothetical protein